jgi:hypothetical protein
MSYCATPDCKTLIGGSSKARICGKCRAAAAAVKVERLRRGRPRDPAPPREAGRHMSDWLVEVLGSHYDPNFTIEGVARLPMGGRYLGVKMSERSTPQHRWRDL